MMTDPRYAIYFVPAPDTALYRFGAGALGYDCFTGADMATLDTLPVDAGAWRELTREPRRYGFHATLKAPFRLAEGRTEAGADRRICRILRDDRRRSDLSCWRTGRFPATLSISASPQRTWPASHPGSGHRGPRRRCRGIRSRTGSQRRRRLSPDRSCEARGTGNRRPPSHRK